MIKFKFFYTFQVWNTWARKCHKALFACNCENISKQINSQSISFFENLKDLENSKNIPIMQLNITEHKHNMADKVLKIIQTAFNKYGNFFKWFLLTDDDTFTFVDNLHTFVSKRSYEEPLTYGFNNKVIVPTGYHNGGAGILLTHEAMRRITNNIHNKICYDQKGYGNQLIGLYIKFSFSYF